MSDEEKEAIEYWKTHMEILHWNTQLASEHYIKVLLDLVEKQSKEIEELNLENIELKQSKIVDKNSIPNQDNFYDCYNFIHKDKIKTKIEELEEAYEDNYIINILESLLEKE